MALFERLKKSLKLKPKLDVQQEVVRSLVTSRIQHIMEKRNISKAVLAELMGISKAAVSGLLNGDRNFTIDKLTEITFHLDHTPRVDFVPLIPHQEIEIVLTSTETTHPIGSSAPDVRDSDSYYSIRLTGTN